jgi:hypothetical protein
LISFLINRFLWGWKGTSIKSRFKWIESKLISSEILSYQYIFWSLKGKEIERRLISIESLSYHFLKENQLKVDPNELKVNWLQLKSFLINRFLGGSKEKSIESRFKSTKSKLISIETRSYQPISWRCKRNINWK